MPQASFMTHGVGGGGVIFSTMVTYPGEEYASHVARLDKIMVRLLK